MLRSGDTLTLYISDEFFPDNTEKSKKHSVLHTLSDDDIAYEDENIIILDKAQGEAVHSSLPDEESKDNEICLVDRLTGYLITKGEYIPENENSFTPALCNRLDRNRKKRRSSAHNERKNQKPRDAEIVSRSCLRHPRKKRSSAQTLPLQKQKRKQGLYISFKSRRNEESRKSKRKRYKNSYHKVQCS